jgi:hypothetical protein
MKASSGGLAFELASTANGGLFTKIDRILKKL